MAPDCTGRLTLRVFYDPLNLPQQVGLEWAEWRTTTADWETLSIDVMPISDLAGDLRSSLMTLARMASPLTLF